MNTFSDRTVQVCDHLIYRCTWRLLSQAAYMVNLSFFTVRLHVMQRTEMPRPYCPSVCLSNA